MIRVSQPVSFSQQHIVSWLVHEADQPPSRQAAASVLSEALHEWAQQRAGQLNPGQREDQLRAAAEYALRIHHASGVSTGLAASILPWLITRLAWYLAQLLFDFLTRDATTLQAWQAVSACPPEDASA